MEGDIETESNTQRKKDKERERVTPEKIHYFLWKGMQYGKTTFEVKTIKQKIY